LYNYDINLGTNAATSDKHLKDKMLKPHTDLTAASLLALLALLLLALLHRHLLAK